MLAFDDKQFLYFILLKRKVNLPLTIFRYLNEKIPTSCKGKVFLHSFWKYLFKLFTLKGIVKKIRKIGFTNVIETVYGSKLYVCLNSWIEPCMIVFSCFIAFCNLYFISMKSSYSYPFSFQSCAYYSFFFNNDKRGK